ncbi:hypothetical protein BDZ97DRAFT_1918921 [Flammula alnicola]|nr:hypothetical protein BDZ97DRAFT_1918921 [Flammula alnicola]
MRNSAVKQKRDMEERTKAMKPLSDRLWSGRGALARHGDYWYPVRLIMRENDGWIVRWWRHNLFLDNTISPDEISLVAFPDLVDSLWGDTEGRRRIRLGQWKHAHEVETSEDILSDPSSIPYSKGIDTILSREKDILARLLLQEDIEDDIPAKQWLINAKKPLNSLIPYAGCLSLIERAQIANWFERHIANDDRALRHLWLGRLPIAHAYTVYISAHLKSTGHKNKLTTKEDRLEKGWDSQFSRVPSLLIDVDIEKECLSRLEEEMFEMSKRAGVAGNAQWGLDSGDHQYWWPYNGLPDHWNHRDREENDIELEHGPNYIRNPSPPAPKRMTPPKPRPIVRQRE